MQPQSSNLRIFYHDDLDGMISAALVMRHLNPTLDITWNLESIQYSSNPDPFANKNVEPQFIVVDFQYHPLALMWFDHHRNPFAHGMEADYTLKRVGAHLYWDYSYRSCAHLVYDSLPALQSNQDNRILAEAADYIDGAMYSSPHEYFSLATSEIALNHAIRNMGEGTKNDIVRQLSVRPLSEVASRVLPLAKEALDSDLRILPRYERVSQRAGDVVVSDLTAENLPYLRFAPYLYHPLVKYSVQMYRTTPSTYGLSMSHNPWNRCSDCMDLSLLAARYGGGGHAYAASIRHLPINQAVRAYAEIMRELKGLDK